MNFRGAQVGDVYAYTLSNGKLCLLVLLSRIDDAGDGSHSQPRWVCLSEHGITKENHWMIEHNVSTNYFRLISSFPPRAE